jgi:TRAP-type mannitol/chloroaromatic compound transport system substrate-binding protein
MAYEFHYDNIHALSKLKKLKVELLQFPQEVTDAGKVGLQEVIEEFSSKNDDFKNVYNSIKKHLELSKEWSDVSLKYFLNAR